MAQMEQILDDPEDLVVSSIEVAGVLEDAEGNKWTIPAGELSEDPSFLVTDPLRVPNKDARFHYEFARLDNLKEYLNGPSQYVYVTRKEAGFGSVDRANRVTGAPDVERAENEAYSVGSGDGALYLLKCPKVFKDRMALAQKRAADRAVEATLSAPQQEAAARMREAGINYAVDRTTKGLKVIEKNPVAFSIEGKDNDRINRTRVREGGE